MAESLLLPLVRDVAGKAADALVETVTRMYGLDDDRQTLERHLLAVECKLANAEEMSEKNPYVKSWMKELKSVAYQADDVLDDFQYEALHRQSRIGKSTTRKALSYITRHSPLLFRFEMSRKLKNVLKKINKLVEEMNKFGLENSVHREKRQHPCRQTHSKLDDCTKIFGRDDDKTVVVKQLLDQQDQQKVKVLPIFGMGGLGKTTLAKMVYNDQEVQKNFQLKMWHCVSDNFDATALLKSIIELAVNKRCDIPDTIELLRKQLEEIIGQKRFLLVLDDVWNEEKRMWEDELKPLLCSVGGPGSVIVVTCRSKQVASIMCTVKPHELVFLSEEDSWELFSNKAFSNGVNDQPELVAIGRRIVNKCGGLPLALKTMGGLLSSKQKVQEWKAIEESNIGDNDGGKYEVMPILKLSYKHLSPEMKQCFAFCAVFSKDYEMEKDRLIQLWMANGFIHEEGTMDLIQKGEFIFDELVWRSFLQDKKVIVKSAVYWGGTNYETIVCKMHDLMHDLAKDVTDECASVEELSQQKALLKGVCHMQMSTAELQQISGLCKGRTYLRTMLAPSESRAEHTYNFLSRSHKDIKELQQVLASLRALDCSPSLIVICKAINAKHLRYLDLSWSDIISLPDSVCMLYNLQTLRLIGCQKLQQLPQNMARLRKLIHLYLSGCDRLRSMSPNFGVLNNLHILTTFVVGTGYGLGIEQLKDLQHLSNRLELLNLSKIRSGKNAKEANLNQKQNLTELLFSWDQKVGDGPRDMACNVEEVLQCLEPHSNIQNLEIRGYGGLGISQWMRKPQMFNSLKELEMSDCPRCKSIPVVWFSVTLEILSLQKMDNLTTLCNNLDVEARGCITPLPIFPGLKRMELIDLPSLEIWAENSVGEASDSLVTFPMLEELKIEKCPKLASIPVIPNISELTIVRVHSTTVSLVFMSIQLGSWPFLAKLTLRSPGDIPMLSLDAQQSQSQIPLEKLKHLYLGGPNSLVRSSRLSRSQLMVWKCFSFVENLTISSCSNLVRWPTEELRSLDCLRSLYIRYCHNLEGKTSSSEEEALPLSLEALMILGCLSVVALPSNLGNLAKLRSLEVNFCSGLKALPDGMCGLTSLRRLSIMGCPALEEFPHGLLERLPALESLSIGGCPELKRRCSEGGEYFHLLSCLVYKIQAA
ncbi:hypothetical protein VPH35_055245 [Triticum aestivum]|uniref:Uncharacterized protein n=4 Tax=Triticum aestivum TaxID=4565 RepID=A0A077S3Y9_WHEAT|nr:unnamed protein product [Triticum aestivum]CDM86100.1 unnamed protein product [Triticum aestivum]